VRVWVLYVCVRMYMHGSRDEMNNERRAALSHRGNNSLTLSRDRSKNTYSANRFHIYSGGGSNFKTRRNKMVRIDDGINMECKKVDCQSERILGVLFPGDRPNHSIPTCSPHPYAAADSSKQLNAYFKQFIFFALFLKIKKRLVKSWKIQHQKIIFPLINKQ
jgi:hypothetical protein